MDFFSMNYIPVMAFFGGSVGASEWLVMFVVILVVVGPRRLPELARKFGRTMEMFRRAADEFKEQLMSMDKDVNDSVADAAGGVDIGGVEGDQGVDQAYGDSYAYDEGAYEDSDYPGNEEIAAGWESQAQSDVSPETPDQVKVSADSTTDGAAEEVSDDPARGESAPTEERV